MKETHAQENKRMLEPYIAHRNQLAHECLSQMLSNHYSEANYLLGEYQLACIAVQGAMDICQWYDGADPIEPD